MNKKERRFISLTFDEPFQLVSDHFESFNNDDERKNFGFLDANRKAVFGQITADGKTVEINMDENDIYNVTNSRANGNMSTVMARLKRLNKNSFGLNDAYVIEEQQIINQSINIPPNLERHSGFLDIVLREPASLSKMQIGFGNHFNQCANAYFSSNELVFVMPSNNDHEIHFERAINNHAKASLPLVGRSIAQQYIHNFMEGEMLEGKWTDVEEILSGLITYLDIQRYQRGA